MEEYLKFDLTSAYKVEALEQLIRSFTYKRGLAAELTVIDEVKFTQPQKFENALIVDTYNEAIINRRSGEWHSSGENQWIIRKGEKAIMVTVSSPGNEIVFNAQNTHLRTGG